MRPGNPNNNKRLRGRPRNNKGPNPLTRTYESNGPDVKVRGTALHIAEKYVQLARDAQSSGDTVMAENYFQHAEHYYRIIAAAQAQSPNPVPFVRDDEGDEEDDAPMRPEFGHQRPAYGEQSRHDQPRQYEQRHGEQRAERGYGEPRGYNGNGTNGHAAAAPAAPAPAAPPPGLGPQPVIEPDYAPTATEAQPAPVAEPIAPAVAEEAAPAEEPAPRRRRSRGSRGRGRRTESGEAGGEESAPQAALADGGPAAEG